MLVATFAVSLLLYNIATLKFTTLGKTVGTLTGLNQPIGHGTLIVRWIWVVDDRRRGRRSAPCSCC